MRSRPALTLLWSLAFVGLATSGAAEGIHIPIDNWAAAPSWTPSATQAPSPLAGGISPLAVPTPPLPFIGVPPCRAADTRDGMLPAGYGPPSIAAATASPRNFILWGQCGIPSTAQAVSFNFTVTNTAGPGFLQVYPQGGSAPAVSTLNFLAGQTVANAAIVPLGTGGGLTAIAGVSGFDLIIDINGYFIPDTPSLTRTVWVGPVGTPAQNGTALLAALAGITTASATNPWLLKIEPGVYDIGSSPPGSSALGMKQYVDIEGSGEGVTTIQMSVCRGSVIESATNAELRFLTVKCLGGIADIDVGTEQAAIAGPVKLTHVTASTIRPPIGGISSVYAIKAEGGTLNDVTVTASGGSVNSVGIVNWCCSPLVVKSSKIQGDGHTIVNVPIPATVTTRVIASQLDGGPVSGTGLTCSGVYDVAFTFFANTCP